MALQETLRHLEQVAVGLKKYHDESGVHGRLCPDRLHRREDGAVVIRSASRSTVTAAVLRYASPEVPGRLDAVGINADLYSIGVMAYEWISGDAPFASNDLLTMAHRQMSFEPEPLYVTSGTPLAVSDLVDRLIQKSRHRRYATVDGLLWDLRECLTRIAHDAKIEPFALGSHDDGATLQFHDRLYGQDAEVAALDDMYQRPFAARSSCARWPATRGLGRHPWFDP